MSRSSPQMDPVDPPETVVPRLPYEGPEES